MRTLYGAAFGGVMASLVPSSVAAQATQPIEMRPATTTASGDTGLWFVPNGEVLPARCWSFSVYRVNFDYKEGFTDVSNWPLTFAAGVADRVEIFAAWDVVRRIDRDVRPLFTSNADSGGLVNDYSLVRQGWSDNQLGDVWIGAKVNLTSQWRRQPAALAMRGKIKIPIATDEDEGVGSGKVDVALDGVVSREFNQRVELSGYGGFMFRGDPDGIDLANGVRWGIGAGFPTRRNLKLTAELHGEKYVDDEIVNSRTITANDGSVAPPVTALTSPVDATLGVTWLGEKWFAGVGLNYRWGLDGRSESGAYEDETGDSLGFQFRLGYHPGVRVYAAPAPQPPAPAPPAASPNRPPTVRARCEPCTVEIGKPSTVSADATDPDGDTLSYRWGAAAGTLASPTDRRSVWTAPMQEGPVPLTVEVNDGRGGLASDAITIQVIRAAVREFVFEDVHFDFDRYSLRPEATRALDEAIRSLQENPQLRLDLEGHTCNIGTAEYNLALGERRAAAVKDYLARRGIGPDRLRTVSYGEERPKHDNAREETRRLNRRAALIVRVER